MLLTVADIARRTQLSEWTVRQAIRDGELSAVKLRGRIRVQPAAVDAWIDDAAVVPVAAGAGRVSRLPARPRLVGSLPEA